MKTIKVIANTKTNSDMFINSLLTGEPITANAKLIADHFDTFFTRTALKLNEKFC